MTLTETAPALLHVALQDLHGGKIMQSERLPAIASRCGDEALIDLIRAEASRADAQAKRLVDAGAQTDGDPNIWMAGIIDDAGRDTRTTQPGRLLDIAIVGAVRKAKAAEIVSSETAMALARGAGELDLLAAVSANRAEEIETDRLLKVRLSALTGVRQ